MTPRSLNSRNSLNSRSRSAFDRKTFTNEDYFALLRVLRFNHSLMCISKNKAKLRIFRKMTDLCNSVPVQSPEIDLVLKLSRNILSKSSTSGIAPASQAIGEAKNSTIMIDSDLIDTANVLRMLQFHTRPP